MRSMLRMSSCILVLTASLCLPGNVFAEPKAMESGSAELLDLQEKALNSTYKRILAAYADDRIFIEKLKNSQRAWLKFRDAELDALFPHSADKGYYGSVYPKARAYWMGKLDEDRTRQLSRWLKGAEEGDAYHGSIRFAPVE